MTQPSCVVFDVNETLSDMALMGQRFADIGAPAQLAKTWFASLLRDGFALAAAGGQETFAVLGRGVLRTLLTPLDRLGQMDRELDDAIDHVMTGFAELPVHPDVAEGVRSLGRAGMRLVTLTNGARTVPQQLFERAGIADQFERLMSVEDAGVWKPARGAYEYAARVCGVEVGAMMLVAVHPWDIDGAARAGMRTAWIDRSSSPYPDYFTSPEITVSSVIDLADHLADDTER
jgi:2-haloacid dehalogenase